MGNTTDILVVGGGLGGLAAAIRLAAAGRRVTLLEKNERVGGKANLRELAGYTFDTGPSLLTMPWVLRDLCAAAGVRLEDELELLPLEPACRYQWPDGTVFTAYQSLPRLLAEIERIAPEDVDGFLRFLAYSRRIYAAVAGPFMEEPPDHWRELIGLRALRTTAAIDPMRTMDQAVRGFFRSPYLRQVFNRYATYNGSSPYRAPATFNVIPYVELAGGAWHPRGGIYALVRLLARLAERLGVCIRTNATVAEIEETNGNVCSVRLQDGERLHAPQIVVNADPGYAYAQLLPQRNGRAMQLQRLERSCSGFVLLQGIQRVYPHLAHHNIFFSHDYPQEFAAIFDQHVPAPDPTVYVCATSVTETTTAPAGHMNWFVLVNAPAHNGQVRWEREAAGYRDVIIRKLERMGLAGINTAVAVEEIITPADLQERYNAPGGAIYGLASNTPWTAFVRPALRAPDVRGLYFVGGGTHPGGGIPLVLLSGRAVTKRVLADRPGQ